jgi:hypothetical protein
MVAQTSMSPRVVTATLLTGTKYNQESVAYNANIAYNKLSATNGSASPRTVATASMKAR